MSLSSKQLAEITQWPAEKRMAYFFAQVMANKQIWILTDEHGCVMLNTDDEDCVPVWPDELFAKSWATAEWEHCQPKAISLAQWQSRWISGLEGDELAIAIFPDQQGEGLVIFPDEFELELKKTPATK